MKQAIDEYLQPEFIVNYIMADTFMIIDKRSTSGTFLKYLYFTRMKISSIQWSGKKQRFESGGARRMLEGPVHKYIYFS